MQLEMMDLDESYVDLVRVLYYFSLFVIYSSFTVFYREESWCFKDSRRCFLEVDGGWDFTLL